MNTLKHLALRNFMPLQATLAGPVLDVEIDGDLKVQALFVMNNDKHTPLTTSALCLRMDQDSYDRLRYRLLGPDYTTLRAFREVESADASMTAFDPQFFRGMRWSPIPAENGRRMMDAGSLSTFAWLKAGDKLDDHPVLKDGFVERVEEMTIGAVKPKDEKDLFYVPHGMFAP